MSPDILSFLSFCLSILFCILLIQIFHIFYNNIIPGDRNTYGHQGTSYCDHVIYCNILLK